MAGSCPAGTLKGAGGTDVTVSGCIAPRFAATVAKSRSLSYRDHGLHWELSEKTGLFSPLAYQAG